jgi:hypothetical protein
MRALLFLFLLTLPTSSLRAEDSLLRYRVSVKVSASESDYVNTVVPAYISSGRDADLKTLQCPIPREDRVRNFTGIQCVWSSIETLGRWAGDERLFDPPLTSRKQCKSYAGPGSAAGVLNSLGVRFEQTYGDRERGLSMIRRATKEGRGALFDVPGHAMVIVHFDEEEDRVCWVDNSDNTLKAQTSTVDRFMKRWGSWVLVVYAEEDIVPYKAYRMHIPVFSEEDSLLSPVGEFVPVPTYIGSNGR